jgi:hypothetical protein
MFDPFVLMEDEGFFYWSRVASGSSNTRQVSAGIISLCVETRGAQKKGATYEPSQTIRSEHG